jgi:hypothetical protein
MALTTGCGPGTAPNWVSERGGSAQEDNATTIRHAAILVRIRTPFML